MVPVGEGAFRRMRGEVLDQPGELRGLLPFATAGDRVALRVQGDEVPGADLVRVPALPHLADASAKVGEVGGSVPGLVLVVAGGRIDAIQEAAPGRVEALRVVAGRAVGIRVVPEERDRPG